jgi:hypothetical protein
MVSGVSAAAGQKAAGQIEKDTNEHRTSNIERRTSNNVFCLFKKKTEQAYFAKLAAMARSGSTLRNLEVRLF